MKLDFSGHTALITGGTRGIGRQVANDLAVLGARVLLTGTNVREAQETASALSGSGHRGLGVDFSLGESMDAFLDEVSRTERIDILINNAGINRLNPVDEVRDEDWDALQLINLAAPLRIVRHVSRLMKTAGYGRIVNIASIYGVVSRERRALYSMTKFGIRGLTIAAAHDLARFGVLVNSVSPGFVRTQLTDTMLSPEEQQRLASQVPLGRFAEPADISSAVIFLTSSLNTYITGQNIVVDGGFVSG